MEKKRGNQILSGVFITVIIISLVVIVWPRPTLLEQRIQELNELGYDWGRLIPLVQESEYSFAEIKQSREVYDNVTWEAAEWFLFKYHVEATKIMLGFVTVWVHREENVMWVAASETTYYYYYAEE